MTQRKGDGRRNISPVFFFRVDWPWIFRDARVSGEKACRWFLCARGSNKRRASRPEAAQSRRAATARWPEAAAAGERRQEVPRAWRSARESWDSTLLRLAANREVWSPEKAFRPALLQDENSRLIPRCASLPRSSVKWLS